MSTTNPQPKNLDAIVLLTGEFAFSPGATSVSDAQVKGYVDFGNVVVVGVKPELEKVEHEGSYRGTRTVDKTFATKNKLTYTLQCDEFDAEKVKLALMGSTATTALAQTAVGSPGEAAAVLAFTTTAGVIGRWYNIIGATTNAGKVIRKITTLTIAVGGGTPPTLVEDTDYVVDYMNGRIRFLNTANSTTAMSRDITPTFQCPAISSTAAGYMNSITPLNDPIKSGYGRLYLYDEGQTASPYYEHVDFSCDVALESMSEADGKSPLTMTFTVTVTGTVGTVRIAE